MSDYAKVTLTDDLDADQFDALLAGTLLDAHGKSWRIAFVGADGWVTIQRCDVYEPPRVDRWLIDWN